MKVQHHTHLKKSKLILFILMFFQADIKKEDVNTVCGVCSQ